MGGEAALSRQTRGEKRKGGEAERAKRKKRARGEPGDESDRGEIDDERDDAQRAARGEAHARAIEAGLQPSQPAAHPSDGMADRAIERLGIADQRLET